MTATDVPVTQLPLTGAQREWVERAWAEIDPDRLARLDLELTGIPSPTGEERAVAEYLADYLATAGFEARYQPIDATQGNAVGRLRGSGDGPELLLYAPTDVAFAATEEEDVPWLGRTIRADLRPQPFLEGENIIGLGAENPKGSCEVVRRKAPKP